MKQMLTASGGVFFAVGLMFLILGGWGFWEKNKFENDLKSRGEFNKTVSVITGFETLNNQELERKQNLISTSLIIAAISGSMGVGLAAIGRTKPTT